MRERKLEKDLKRRKKKSAEERGEDLQDTVARCPVELPPPLRKLKKKPKKQKKTYPPLSDLRQSPPPLFAPSRAQEFPTLPPKPLKVLPKPEEDKNFLKSEKEKEKRKENRERSKDRERAKE